MRQHLGSSLVGRGRDRFAGDQDRSGKIGRTLTGVEKIDRRRVDVAAVHPFDQRVRRHGVNLSLLNDRHRNVDPDGIDHPADDLRPDDRPDLGG